MVMKRYLNQITADEAVTIIKSVPPHCSSRRIPVADAVGHRLSASLFALYSVPEVPVSAMDGFAVRSS